VALRSDFAVPPISRHPAEGWQIAVAAAAAAAAAAAVSGLAVSVAAAVSGNEASEDDPW
jgi:hypothetical protein